MAIPAVDLSQPQARAGLGWRVLGAFVRRREASIFVVAIALSLFFSVKSDAFYSGDNFKNMGSWRIVSGRSVAESATPTGIII